MCEGLRANCAVKAVGNRRCVCVNMDLWRGGLPPFDCVAVASPVRFDIFRNR